MRGPHFLRDVVLLTRPPASTHPQWPSNANWWSPTDSESDFNTVVAAVRQSIRCQATQAARLGKPMVVGEFGFPRDRGSLSPSAGTSQRDRRVLQSSVGFTRLRRKARVLCLRWCFASVWRSVVFTPTTRRFYTAVFDEVVASARAGGSLAGANFWCAVAHPQREEWVLEGPVTDVWLAPSPSPACCAAQGLLWRRLPGCQVHTHEQV